MNTVKEWAVSVCMTLIITGTVYKFLPEKSSKNLVRFIITLICLTCVFRIDISDFELFDFNGGYSQSIEQSQEVKSDIEKIIGDSLLNETEKILTEYDKDGKINIKSENGHIVLNVAAKLNDNDKRSFEKEVREKLETEIEFIYP